MGGKITSALSQETRDLLRDNKAFFDSVAKLTKLGVKGKDAEAKTEVELRDDGNIAVSFILPIDDNGKAGDGRIYLRDTFVFDPKQQKFQDYKRDFQYNGRGENKEEWKQWLAKYQGAALPNQEDVRSFALVIALSYARPFRAEYLPIFSKHKSEFFGDLLSGIDQEGLKLMVKDPRSHYAVIDRGITKELIFSYVVADPSGNKSGNLVVQDKFVFQGNSKEIVGFDRLVKPSAENADDADWKGRAE